MLGGTWYYAQAWIGHVVKRITLAFESRLWTLNSFDLVHWVPSYLLPGHIRTVSTKGFPDGSKGLWKNGPRGKWWSIMKVLMDKKRCPLLRWMFDLFRNHPERNDGFMFNMFHRVHALQFVDIGLHMAWMDLSFDWGEVDHNWKIRKHTQRSMADGIGSFIAVGWCLSCIILIYLVFLSNIHNMWFLNV